MSYVVTVRVRRAERGPLWVAWIATYYSLSGPQPSLDRPTEEFEVRYFVRFRRKTAVRAATRHFLRSWQAKHDFRMQMQVDG